MNMMFAMFNGWEIVLILALALILFGAKKLPELARGLGQGIREFRRSTREVTDELQAAVDMDEDYSPRPQRKIQSSPQNAAKSTENNEQQHDQAQQTGSSEPAAHSAVKSES